MRKYLDNFLLAASIGDICGSVYEFNPVKEGEEVNLKHPGSDYTDDTVCTFSIAKSLLKGCDTNELAKNLQEDCKNEIARGYGGMFMSWLENPERKPYGSFGNGSAMRVSSAGYMATSRAECERLSEMTACVTHNHPEGIKGAVAIALAINDCLHYASKQDIKANILDVYYPEFSNTKLEDLVNHPNIKRCTCQISCPAALIAFLESESFEDCMIKCIKLKSDSDTLCAIAAPIAYAYYEEIPEELIDLAIDKLPVWMLNVNEQFNCLEPEL